MRLPGTMESRVLMTVIILVIGGWFFMPQSGVDRLKSELSEATKNRVILEKEIADLNKAKNSLLERDSALTISNLNLRKKLAETQEKAGKTTIIYRTARAATESRPDSANMATELIAARELIDTQEGHINALLELQASTDSLLASKIAIINNQEQELMKWPELVDNLKAEHKQELKAEKKRGNKKFLAGVGVGALAILLIL